MPESQSKTESEKAAEPKREPREPRALSNEYHKARKQLMLWSAILFIWELVGIDLEKAKEAGGNAGAIIGALKSPQAVPWALLVLVGYFGFKLRVEWRQCNPARRSVTEARQDYYSAFLVAFCACALYFGQTISRVQFADLLRTSNGARSSLAGSLVGFLVVIVSVLFARARESKIRSARVVAWAAFSFAAVVGVTVAIVESLYQHVFSILQLLLGFLTGSILPFLLIYLISKRQQKLRSRL